MSGIDVPMANILGRIAPYGVDNTIGINVMKNKTNIVGQKPKEKLTPNKNAPNLPFFTNLFGTLPNVSVQLILK